MGFWANLFGTSNVVNKSLNLIDEAFYTDDERSERKKELLKAYEPFKLAQRLLAVMFCGCFILLVIVATVTSYWFDVSKQFEIIQEYFSLPVSLIVGFYFAGGMGEGLIDKFRNKK